MSHQIRENYENYEDYEDKKAYTAPEPSTDVYDHITNGADLEHITFKILVVGEPSVGKTSLIHRYTTNTFQDVYKSTIGVGFLNYNIRYNDKIIHLHFWDLAGQDRLNNQVKVYYREAAGALCVCDVTDADTRIKLLEWKELVKQNCTRRDGVLIDPPCIMVLNKMDLCKSDPNASWVLQHDISENNKNNSNNNDEKNSGFIYDPILNITSRNIEGEDQKINKYETIISENEFDSNITPRELELFYNSGWNKYSLSMNEHVDKLAIKLNFDGGVPVSVKENIGVKQTIKLLVKRMYDRYIFDKTQSQYLSDEDIVKIHDLTIDETNVKQNKCYRC